MVFIGRADMITKSTLQMIVSKRYGKRRKIIKLATIPLGDVIKEHLVIRRSVIRHVLNWQGDMRVVVLRLEVGDLRVFSTELGHEGLDKVR